MVAPRPTSPRENASQWKNETRIAKEEPQRRFHVRYGNESEGDSGHQLQLQKDEYEAIIQRHLKFIDQVVIISHFSRSIYPFCTFS